MRSNQVFFYGDIPKNSLPNPIYKDSPPPPNLYILTCTFRSVIHFLLIFVYGSNPPPPPPVFWHKCSVVKAYGLFIHTWLQDPSTKDIIFKCKGQPYIKYVHHSKNPLKYIAQFS